MIRQVELQDAKAITNIYNEYVLHSVATFDTEPVPVSYTHLNIADVNINTRKIANDINRFHISYLGTDNDPLGGLAYTCLLYTSRCV